VDPAGAAEEAQADTLQKKDSPRLPGDRPQTKSQTISEGGVKVGRQQTLFQTSGEIEVTHLASDKSPSNNEPQTALKANTSMSPTSVAVFTCEKVPLVTCSITKMDDNGGTAPLTAQFGKELASANGVPETRQSGSRRS